MCTFSIRGVGYIILGLTYSINNSIICEPKASLINKIGGDYVSSE